MAAKKKTTKKTEARPKPSSANKKPVQKTGSRPAAQKAPAKKTTPKTAKQLSALDAAVRVLAETGHPMNCREMIDAMAEKGYWTSPAGKTPSATLYTAVT